jgi:hypothetical protein
MSHDQKKDNLKQDPIVPGQDYCVFSFVNPKDHVLGKQLHYVNSFMVNDINKCITAQAIQMVRKLHVDMRKKVDDVLDKLKYSVDEEDKAMSRILEKRCREMLLDEDSYIEECRRRYELDQEELLDKYKIFLAKERTKLDREYDEAHDNQTTTRGIKFRGSYARYDDARDRAKYVRDNVEHGIHAFVIPIGVWVPIDMDADEVQDQDYMIPQLNELMGKYHEGTHARNQHYQERKREMEEDAANGNKLNTKERLQAQLRQKRNEKMRDEMAQFEKLTTDSLESDKKKRKRRKKKVADSLTSRTDPELQPGPGVEMGAES